MVENFIMKIEEKTLDFDPDPNNRISLNCANSASLGGNIV